MKSPELAAQRGEETSSNQSTSADSSLGPSDAGGARKDAISPLGGNLTEELSKAAKPWNWGPPFIIAFSAALLYWALTLMPTKWQEELARVSWEVLPYIIGNIVLEASMREMVRRKFPEHADPWSLSDCFAAFPQYPFYVFCAGHAALTTPQTIDGRFLHQDEWGYIFLRAYTAKTLVHLPLLWMTDIRPKQRIMMIGHHALSIVAYSNALFSHRCLYHASMAGMCEVSTTFLTLMWILKETKTDKVYKTLHVVNGACLWLSFVVFRLMLFPFYFYQFFTDLYESYEVPEKWDLVYTRAGFIEFYVYPLTVLFLLVVSTMWFGAIHKGMIKALKGNDDFKTKSA